MSLGLGKCPHRPYEIALAIEDTPDLIAYFALRMRLSEYDKWVLDQKLTVPMEGLPPPPSYAHPEYCVGCGHRFNTEGGKLHWGCQHCRKIVNRSNFYHHLLELRIPAQLLDWAYAHAMEALNERDHSR